MSQAAERQTKLTIDLGGEQIEIVRLDASEGLSQAFIVSIDMVSSLGEVDLLQHLGKPATVSISEDGELLRYFNGILVDGEYLGEVDGGAHLYRLTLKPKAYLHEQGRNFKMFQDTSVKDILDKVFAKCSIKAEFGKLTGGQRVRPYCVQYGESDFGFASRLMEEEGIYYFYQHTDAEHILVLCDSPGAHEDGKASPLVYDPTAASVFNVDSAERFLLGQKMFLQSWHERVATGAESTVTFRDFDFTRAAQPLEVKVQDESLHPEDAIEIYSYPGRYYKETDGKALSETVLESRRANRRTYHGECQIASVMCGTTFKLDEHPIDRYNIPYLVTHCEHSIGTEQSRSGTGTAEGHFIRIEAVPADVLWKAPIATRRPVVAGPETAIVTGPEGETIHVDEYGRVKVLFHWDRDEKEDKGNTSCWIRVSQTGGLGNIIIPRVGHEVLVDFINGDPDRPVIVGRVFNSVTPPKYQLPANKTIMTWASQRYGEEESYGEAKMIHTGRRTSNEIKMDDRSGSEELFVHAQRDLNTNVEHSETHTVGGAQSITVGVSRVVTVGVDENVTIGANRVDLVGGDETRSVGGRQSITIGDDKSDTIGADYAIAVGGSLNITAGKVIKLVVGDSSIVIDGSSITMKTLSLNMTADIAAKLEAKKVDVDAMGFLTLKGGLVKIN